MTAIIDGTNGVTTPNVLTSSSGVALTLQSGGTTAVTIDTSQNVTLNSATAQLTVTGNGSTSGLIVASNVASRPSTSNPMLQITSGAGSGIYGYAGNAVLSGRPTDTNGYGNIYIQTGSTQQNQWTFSNGANLILPGGSTSATGTGITFPATQSASSDANTLDDYEEGTWTPTLTNATTYGSGNSGRYIKIGKQVFINGNLDVSVYNNTGSTTVNIGGFPFATDSYNQVYAQGVLFQVVGCNQANMNLIMQLSQSQTVATLYTVAPTTGTNYTAVIPTTFGTQVIIEFSAVYISNA